MNDNLPSGIDKASVTIQSPRSTNLITTSAESDNNFTTTANSTIKPSPRNIPENETQSCILESGALMCVSTGTIPSATIPESVTHGQRNNGNSNIPNSSSNSLRNSIKRAKTSDKFEKTSYTECGGGNKAQPNNNAICDWIMHESPPSSISNTQENPPKPNLESAKRLCDRKGTLETISPPTYHEATALNSKTTEHQSHDNICIQDSTVSGKISVEPGSIRKKFLSTENKRKSIEKVLSHVAAPVATAAILLPSINNAQKCATVNENIMDNNSETTNMLCDNDTNENKKSTTVVMQEKKCSTPSSRILTKEKLLEKKQSESFISTPDSLVGNLRSKMMNRRKSQGGGNLIPKTKTNITSAKEVSFSSSDQLNRRDEHGVTLGGVTKNTQNTFDLLAERCHGGKRKTASPQSLDSPDSIKTKTNYALEEKTAGNKSLFPKDHPKLISDNMTRTSSLKYKYGSSSNGKSSKGQKPERLESGRQLTNAELASALAVSSAFAAASDSQFGGKRSMLSGSDAFCSSEPASCVRSQYQTPNHVSGNVSNSSTVQSPTAVINNDGIGSENSKGKKWQKMWKKAAGHKGSMTSDSSTPRKSIVFDVAEAEALMNEFNIAAPLSSGRKGSNELVNKSTDNHEPNMRVDVTPSSQSSMLVQRKRSICKSIAPSTGRSSRPLSPTAFDEVAEDGNNSINYPLMDGRNSTSDFDPETHNPRAMILDVGGRRHKVLESNFSVFPNTRLGKLARARNEEEIIGLCDGYRENDGYGVPEYFFDRNWTSFNSILDIYRTGVLHLNTDLCALVLQKDLEYWQIDELILEPCCALKYYPEIEICVKEQKGEQEAKRKEAQRLEDENFGSHIIGRTRTFLWNLMEYPETSKGAQVMAFTSLGIVLISTMTFVLGTFPEFQLPEETGIPLEYPTIKYVMDIIDNIAVVFFLIEYTIRMVCAPKKFQFFIGPMNLVDLFAILPFFLDLIIGGLQDFEIMGKAGKIVRLVRVMRIMRIFKLVRHFAGLQSLIYTLNQAYKELGLLMLLVGVAVLTFSSLVYFAEKDNPKGSWSFLDSFWWGLMTLTTVGYGDLSPSTFPGKLIGGLCALGGIFILTLPIPIVVNSFASYYKNRLWRNEVAYKKRQRARKRKEMELLMRDNLLNILTVPVASTINAVMKEDPNEEKTFMNNEDETTVKIYGKKERP